MPPTEEKHRAAVANYMAGKIREFGYQLRLIVEACNRSALEIANGQRHSELNDQEVAYGFSAFGNAMQSLKDGLKTVAGTPITWSQMGALAHGSFMYGARNAMTHDGNPVINAWIDGKYFVASNIDRFGIDNEPVEIKRPEVDVRTLCLTFAKEFSSLLAGRLEPLLGQIGIARAGVDPEDIEAVAGWDRIPAEVRSLLAEKKEEILEVIANAPYSDPIEKAMKELDELQAYCDIELSRI